MCSLMTTATIILLVVIQFCKEQDRRMGELCNNTELHQSFTHKALRALSCGLTRNMACQIFGGFWRNGVAVSIRPGEEDRLGELRTIIKLCYWNDMEFFFLNRFIILGPSFQWNVGQETPTIVCSPSVGKVQSGRQRTSTGHRRFAAYDGRCQYVL